MTIIDLLDSGQLYVDASLLSDLVHVMRECGIEEGKIYATRKTGLLPTPENWDSMTAADRRAWAKAINEYDELQMHKRCRRRS